MARSKKTGASQQYSQHPFLLTAEQLSNELETNTEKGLASAALPGLQRKYGENKLDSEGGVKWYSVLLKQISNAMILVRFLHLRT